MRPGDLILQNGRELEPEAAPWLLFRRPERVIRTDVPCDVGPALAQVAEAVDSGAWAAGFLAYEAAAGLDPAFRTAGGAPLGGLPLLWFGIYERPERAADAPVPQPFAGFTLTDWQPALDPSAYAAQVDRIREWIAAGDTYQVNFSYPMQAAFEGDPPALLAALRRAQPTGFAAILRLPEHAIVSASPELFFVQSGDRVVARPMKGTARRGRWLQEDDRRAAELEASPKDRAENVMIVDLLRNDLGRLAIPGAVKVERLFSVERYPTVLQLTSTIAARTDAGPVEVLAALFPCGSITGAPKIRTMQIIAELEGRSRGIYTGAIGWIAPGRRARFSVAIRTVQLDLEPGEADDGSLRGRATFGVGGGITWGSDAAAEYRETRDKAALLLAPHPEFRLLESMLWQPGDGILLRGRHVGRLRDSAKYFDFPFEAARIEAVLDACAARLPAAPHKLRLLLAADGTIETQAAPVGAPCPDPDKIPADTEPKRIGLATTPVDSADPFLFHKTTRRGPYDRALGECPDRDDAILINERGQLTEASSSNLVVSFEGRLWTPPRECGLLAGTLRDQWIADGRLAERTLRPEDLVRAEAVWLINSVRGWMPAVLVDAPAPSTPAASSARGIAADVR
jgi:para-aminobenzoate synthetase/4-amino-4-deoxychorismate lyase